VLPALIQARATRRALGIWCAPHRPPGAYSIAMLVRKRQRCPAGVSDRRHRSVAGCAGESKSGVFQSVRVQRGLPIQMLVKYFQADRRPLAAQCPISRAMVRIAS